MSVKDSSIIMIDDSRVMLQIVAPLTVDSRGIIYNRYMFIVHSRQRFTCQQLNPNVNKNSNFLLKCFANKINKN